MMNMIQLQEQLKDFSQDQLINEMRMPSGNVPQYLVLSEMQRRKRMEAAAAGDQGRPQTTVAEDAVAAAGVPQGGIAQMARSLAPQTDMTQNTGQGQSPVTGMSGGGTVRRMENGGLAGISRDLGDYAPSGMTPANAYPPITYQEWLNMSRNERRAAGLPESPIGGQLHYNRFGVGLGWNDPETGEPVSRPERERMTIEEAAQGEFAGMGDGVPAGGTGEGYYPTWLTDMLQGAEGTVADVVAVPQRIIGQTIGGVGTLLDSEGIQDYGQQVYESGDRLAEEGFFPGGGRSGPQDIGEIVYDLFPDAMEAAGIEDPAIARQRARDEREARAERQRIAEEGALPMTTGDTLQVAPGESLLPTSATQTPASDETGGAGGASDADRLAEQDRWLALARFGLGLMSSRSPTFGGAIGEAGMDALDYMQGMEQQRYERDLAERTLAARSAGSDQVSPPPYQLVSGIVDQIGLIDEQLRMMNPEQNRAQYDELLRTRQYLMEQANAVRLANMGPWSALLSEQSGSGVIEQNIGDSAAS